MNYDRNNNRDFEQNTTNKMLDYALLIGCLLLALLAEGIVELVCFIFPIF